MNHITMSPRYIQQMAAPAGGSQFLLAKLDALSTENEKLKKENEDLQIKHEQSLSGVNVQTQVMIKELQDELNDVKLAKTESDTKVRSLENELQLVKAELANKRRELDAAKQSLSELEEKITSKEKEIDNLNAKGYDKNVKINELTRRMSEEKASAQSFLADQISQKDKELAALNQNYGRLQEQNYMKDETIRQLKIDLEQANQR